MSKMAQEEADEIVKGLSPSEKGELIRLIHTAVVMKNRGFRVERKINDLISELVSIDYPGGDVECGPAITDFGMSEDGEKPKEEWEVRSFYEAELEWFVKETLLGAYNDEKRFELEHGYPKSALGGSDEKEKTA